MKRRKRFAIRMVALGFAVTALAAPVAQAGPYDMTGPELRAVHESFQSVSPGNVVGSPDDRAFHGLSSEPVISPDDRTIHGMTPDLTYAPMSADDSSGFELGTNALSGLVLFLAAGGAALVVLRQTRKGKLASA